MTDHRTDPATDEGLTERLSAFIDGEIDEFERRETRLELERDGAARRRLSSLLSADDAVRDQFDAVLAQDPPARLVNCVSEGFAQRRRGRLSGFAGIWVGVAASAAAVVIGSFVMLERWVEHRAVALADVRQAELRAVLAQTVQEALERAESGQRVRDTDAASAVISIMPTRTYRSASKHWCREFEERVSEDGREIDRKGLACRGDDGVWRRIRTTIEGDEVSL